MSTPKPSTPADRMKAQGNALHVAGKYKGAHKKYSEAIKLDPTNAILWANRAASSLAMKDYLDAATDAEKASQLDPDYAKAWARHATALHCLSSYQSSIRSWTAALNCLPSAGDLSPEQESLKSQFNQALKKAQDAMRQPPATQTSLSTGSLEFKNMPWKRALAMEKELIKTQRWSSAWVIMNAYRDINHGMDTIRQMKRTIIGNEVKAEGMTGALTELCHGVLRDTRAFHIDNMPDFFERYDDQLRVEGTLTKAWDNAGPKLIQQEAPKRLKTSGWDVVRPALSTTVRAWIIHAFIQNTVEHSSPEYYRNALEILEWGSDVWKDVPNQDRGMIFEAPFIRAVKRLYLKSLMETYKRPESGHSLDEIASYARALIMETRRNPAPEDASFDFDYWASFWPYVEADALAVLGWCSMQSAFRADDDETSMKLFAEAAEAYTVAAETFMKDDENHAYFLKIALEAHWWQDSPLSITLPLAKRIREALPEIKKIWEFSMFSKRLSKAVQQALNFEEEQQKRVSEGIITLNSSARPKDMGPEQLRKRKEMARG